MIVEGYLKENKQESKINQIKYYLAVLNSDYVFDGKYDKDNNPCFNFGAHKGKKVIDVFKTTPDYITWIIVKSDFPMGVKKIISEIINKPVEG